MSIPSPQEHNDSLKRRTYRAILELSARHPLLNSSDIALMTGASQAWVKKLMASDAFRAERAKRVQELFGPRLQEISNKLLETTSKLIDAIAARIADPDAAVTEDTLLKATALLLGHVNPKGAAPATPTAPAEPAQPRVVIFNGVTPEDMLRARQKALEHGASIKLDYQPAKEKVIDVDEDGIPTPARLRSNEGID